MMNATTNANAAAIHCAVGPKARRLRYRPFRDRVGRPFGGVVRFGDVSWTIGSDGTTRQPPSRAAHRVRVPQSGVCLVGYEAGDVDEEVGFTQGEQAQLTTG
jgi:hypothetical protein